MREHVTRLTDELERYGLTAKASITNGNHIRIAWQTPAGAPRTMVVANTPSDYRATLNNLAAIKRQCRADNIEPAEPKRTIREQDLRDKAGRFDISPLLARIAELEQQLVELFDHVTVPTPVLLSQPPEEPESKRTSSTSLLQYLDMREWTNTAEIVRRAHRPYANVLAGLKQLERKGLAVNYNRVGWKRTPPEAVRIAHRPVVITLPTPEPKSAPVLLSQPPAEPERKSKREPWVLEYLTADKWTGVAEIQQRSQRSYGSITVALAYQAKKGVVVNLKRVGWKRTPPPEAVQTAPAPTEPSAEPKSKRYPIASVLQYLNSHEWTGVAEIARRANRPCSPISAALKLLAKRGLAVNLKRVGWKRIEGDSDASPTTETKKPVAAAQHKDEGRTKSNGRATNGGPRKHSRTTAATAGQH